jgi:hypothetical protein
MDRRRLYAVGPSLHPCPVGRRTAVALPGGDRRALCRLVLDDVQARIYAKRLADLCANLH